MRTRVSASPVGLGWVLHLVRVQGDVWHQASPQRLVVVTAFGTNEAVLCKREQVESEGRSESSGVESRHTITHEVQTTRDTSW